jgi:hypothetical protein
VNTLDIDTLDNGTTLIITDDNDRNFKFRKTNDRWWLIVTNADNTKHLRSEMHPNTVRDAITEASFITIKEGN